MFFIYKTTDGIDSTGGLYKLLANGDRAYVAANALLYSSAGSVFGLSGDNRIDIAGEVVAQVDAIRALNGASPGNIINVLAGGAITAAGTAINMAVGATSLSNAGSISGATGVSLVSSGNVVVNSGTITGDRIAVKLGDFQTQFSNYLTNTGLIAAADQDGVAIKLDGAGYTSIDNSGHIVAAGGTAISVAALLQLAVSITNTGVIEGQISLGASSDEVTNSGTIVGGVDLGGGDDRFDGSAATVAATVFGGSGDDELRGGSGNDLLGGGVGADLIDGGAGFDTVFYDGSSGVLVDLADSSANAYDADGDVLVSIEAVIGGDNGDVLLGAAGNERLIGGGGDDSLSGRAGQDALYGLEGDDTLDGGSGNDRLFGGDGIDTADYGSAIKAVTVRLSTIGVQDTGGAGRDRLVGIENVAGSRFNDTLTGDYLDNRLSGGAGNDTLTGGDGDDRLAGGADTDTLVGGAGFDSAVYADAATAVTVSLVTAGAQNTGGGGTDTLTGIEGVIGSGFDDKLTGNDAANRLDGSAGNDTLTGAGGDDVLRGDDGTDKLDGGAGFDIADYSGAENGVRVKLAVTGPQQTLGAGLDTLTGIEGVFGGIFADTLTGDANANLFQGRDGDDTINGGGGLDTASYADASGAVSVSLSVTGAQATGGAGTDTLTLIENLTGSAFDDTLTGSTGANVLDGGDGTDVLNGLDGNDVFIASFGNDTLNGGGDFDTADYSAVTFGITVDLSAAQQKVFIFFTTQLVNSVEAFIGTDGADTFISSRTSVNTYTGGEGADRYLFAPGSASQNTITDFSGASGDGDTLIFQGYAADATFTQVDATHFKVSDSAHSAETITFTNAPTIDIATDVQFTI